MRMLLLSGLIVPLALVSTAHADFVVASSPTSPPSPIIANTEETPGTTANESPSAAGDSHAAAPARPSPRTLFIARGFGDQVPLGFAVRQIVPKSILVKFGPGADAATLVSWKGGQPWNRVLVTAVRPIGLRVIMGNATLELRK